MSFIQGFQFKERLYESESSLVIRAIRERDGLPVVVKILKKDFPTTEELVRYRREFEITAGLDLPGVAQALDLQRHEKSLFMAVEDFDGMSIAQLMDDRALSYDELLETAIQVATTLGLIHKANVIHKDISPQNLIINPSTGEVKIIDFGLSTKFSREEPVLKNPDVLEGTLHYISPEQTGRMNRTLDHRTDLYSLGATLYEMATGETPFDAQDKTELVHCHIARDPVPAHRRNPDVPLAFAKIIGKLMAKKAEERYQSAEGLLADLETVRRGQNLDRFEPARRDFSAKFQIPERLYGREHEVLSLLEAFERARQSTAEMILVAGYSGVGKTAIVREVHKPITRARGYFISGKYDQFKRNEPYSGITAALRDLVRQLLTENEAKLAEWSADINSALGPNAQVILDVLPELEMVIGPQPAIAHLEPAEAKNRFDRTIGQLLRALCARDRVIALFLDDLQWADTASLNLLRVILTDGGIERLLLIGAYRDNEVDPMHPLIQTVDKLREAGGKVSEMTLAPLGLTEVAKLSADTLQTETTEMVGLARLIVQKTQGNPLFVRQFLMDLNHEGLISRAPLEEGDKAVWSWDIEAIRAASITENVVDLLLRKLRRLPEKTQDALQLAACIGSRFDLDTLALIQKTDATETFEFLSEALDEGLIRPTSEFTTSQKEDALSPLIVRRFAFQHDRVQQAAYNLIDETRLKEVHLAIGERLQATLSEAELSERIFGVVDHLNFGRDLIADTAKRIDLARLNLVAAHKATDSIAYTVALSQVKIAQELLGENGWEENYDLMIEVFRNRASLEYIVGNLDTCNEIIGITLENVQTDLEKAEVYFTRIAQHTLLGEFPQAVEAGSMALALVGVELPSENLEDAGQQAIGSATGMLEGIEIASLYDRPDATDPAVLLAQRCLRHLTIAAFLYNQQLFPIIVGTSVKLSLEHGNCPESALSYSNYGLVLGAFMMRYKDGMEFGQLAMRLCDKFEGRAPVATVCLVHGSELIPWVRHVNEAIKVIDRGYEAGLDSGDILWAGYLVMYRVILDTFAGKPLDHLLDKMPEQLGFTSTTQNIGAEAGVRAYQIVLSTLAGRTRSSTDFSGVDMDEASFLKACNDGQLNMAKCLYNILKAQALFLFGRPAEALMATEEIQDLLSFIVNHPNLADHLLYQSLSMAALHSGGNSPQELETLERMKGNLGQLTIWSDNCPENYLAKKLMVEAEIARVTGDDIAAADLYDGAIDAAQKNQILQDEALANELAARFVMERRSKSRVGAMYLRDARHAYQLWGAHRKVEELELEFPQLLAQYHENTRKVALGTETEHARTQSASIASASSVLDLDTLTKAAQTISGEVMLPRLLDRLLGILIENAGAQRGVLLLNKGRDLVVEAESSVSSGEASVLMSIPMDSADGAKLVPAGMLNYVKRAKQVIVLEDAQTDERFQSDPYFQEMKTRSVLCQPIEHQGKLIGVVYLENDLFTGAFTPARAQLLSLLSGQIAVSIKNTELVENLEDKVRERTEQLELHSQFIEQTFGRYLSNEIADRLLRSPDGLDFAGRKQTVTVMMSDLRGFATFSDVLPPETIVKLLNNYLSEMTSVIQKYNGTIDAFIGDAILAVFGAPFQRPDDAERAVACALEMQLAMTKVNAWNLRNGLPDLEMGVGVNTGEVVVGNIGSNKRAKYSVIGGNVNLAARIEGYTVGGQVLISESTKQEIKAAMTLGKSAVIEPKGMASSTSIHDVLGLGGTHNLVLEQQSVEARELDPPVPLKFRLLVDKAVVGEEQSGQLLKLSSTEALIQSDAPPEPFTDLQLLLTHADGSGTATGIYAKVLNEKTGQGTFAVRFTAVPLDARSLVEDLGS